jgi:hypothetical protein
MSEPTLGERMISIEIKAQTHLDSFDTFKDDYKQDRKDLIKSITDLKTSVETYHKRLGLAVAIVMACITLIKLTPELQKFLVVVGQ